MRVSTTKLPLFTIYNKKLKEHILMSQKASGLLAFYFNWRTVVAEIKLTMDDKSDNVLSKPKVKYCFYIIADLIS